MGLRDTQELRAKDNFERIVNSGEHLLGVINDVLDFSKIEAGKLEIVREPFQLISAIKELEKLFIDKAKVKGLTFSVVFAADVPEWVIGDSLRLTQIVLNLLSNAIKFTEHGFVALEVSCQGDMLNFLVKDTGIGMKREDIDRLFIPFEQADSSTTRKFGGTGLGLAISFSLSQAMGGKIRVESEEGKGSVFIFSVSLPKVEAHDSHQSLIAKAHQHDKQHRLQGLNILAAEDVEINRFVLEDMLQQEGAEVAFAENGQQALDMLAVIDKHYDLVLMDVQMPVMDGYIASKLIRASLPDIPIIALTAHAMDDERQKALDAGMNEHITKPVDSDRLVAVILEILRSSTWGEY